MATVPLPEQFSNIIEYICRNTFVNTVYGGQPREFWPVGNGTRQGGIASGIIFNFYINGVLDAIMNFIVGCSLNCSNMNILCYAEDIVLVAPTAQAHQFMLNSLSHTIRSLSLKTNFKRIMPHCFPP